MAEMVNRHAPDALERDDGLVPDARPFIPGCPIDERKPGQRSRAEQGYLGDVEWSAARVVARFTGERVFLQDDGSEPSMADMRIDRANGDHAFVEVWTDTDKATAATFNELLGPGLRLPAEWLDPRLTRVWHVRVSKYARFRSGRGRWQSLQKCLVPVLAEMEASGETFEFVAAGDKLVSLTSPLVARLVKLGVCEVSSRPVGPHEQGLVRLSPPGIIGSSARSWKPLYDWLAATLDKPELDDNWKKLKSTGVRELHFMMGVTWSSPGDVYFALTGQRGVPSVAPRLPTGITNLWVFDAIGFDRVLVWSAEDAWLDACHHWATP